MQNRFNLTEEPWIPIANVGRVSLKEVFRNQSLKHLGGNAIQKISVLKLLLAIAQRAATPENDEEWQRLGVDGLSKKCLSYLETHKDDFWLYGEKPFLQIPEIIPAQIKGFGIVSPEIAAGNTTILFSSQIEKPLNYSDQALLILQLVSFAFSGKQTDNSIVLSNNYKGKMNDKGKESSGREGPSLGYSGFQHSFYTSSKLIETIYCNLLTQKDIYSIGFFSTGIGIPPWEQAPKGEIDEVALSLKSSYMGRLIPMCRFMLLTDSGLHYSEGIAHGNYLDGIWDLSVTVNFSEKKPRAIWIDPSKKPWRQLTSTLAFLSTTEPFLTFQLKLPFERIKLNFKIIEIWSGGVKVSSNAGERYCSGTDDFIESNFIFETKVLGEVFFSNFSNEMDKINKISTNLWATINAYYKEHKLDKKEKINNAVNQFWQYCEQSFQDLIDQCSPGGDLLKVRKKIVSYLYKVYDQHCPRNSAKQLQLWAKHRPRIGTYLSELKLEKEEEVV